MYTSSSQNTVLTVQFKQSHANRGGLCVRERGQRGNDGESGIRRTGTNSFDYKPTRIISALSEMQCQLHRNRHRHRHVHTHLNRSQFKSSTEEHDCFCKAINRTVRQTNQITPYFFQYHAQGNFMYIVSKTPSVTKPN